MHFTAISKDAVFILVRIGSSYSTSLSLTVGVKKLHLFLSKTTLLFDV
jgi:hypothetical protein